MVSPEPRTSCAERVEASKGNWQVRTCGPSFERLRTCVSIPQNVWFCEASYTSLIFGAWWGIRSVMSRGIFATIAIIIVVAAIFIIAQQVNLI